MELIKTFPDASYRIIILDPPYVQHRDIRTANDKRWSTQAINWSELFTEAERLLMPRGVIFLFGIPSFYLKIANDITRHFRVYFDLVWEKPSATNFLIAKRRPLVVHECILVLTRRYETTEIINYKDIVRIGLPSERKRKGVIEEDTRFGILMRAPYRSDGYRYPTTVTRHRNKPTMKYIERTPHPTQKPISLMEFLVLGWSNEGDRVLDPFAGSGTTAIVCEMHNRFWDAIEINGDYVNLIKSRLEKIDDLRQCSKYPLRIPLIQESAYAKQTTISYDK